MIGKKNNNIVSIKSRVPRPHQPPKCQTQECGIALSRSTPAFRLPYKNNVACMRGTMTMTMTKTMRTMMMMRMTMMMALMMMMKMMLMMMIQLNFIHVSIPAKKQRQYIFKINKINLTPTLSNPLYNVCQCTLTFVTPGRSTNVKFSTLGE